MVDSAGGGLPGCIRSVHNFKVVKLAKAVHDLMVVVVVKLPLKGQTQQANQNSSQNNQNTWQNYSGNSSSQNQAPSSYTVQEGDSLSKIARENNTSVHHLEQLNGLESADSISICQSIKLK